MQPSYYYGRQHDYVYYPESWTDQASGTHYEKGYYDENGQYYDSVAFARNGTYENVVCECPYCGQNTVLTLTAEDAASHNLQCPHCGGPMEIRSELDDYVSQSPANTHSYQSEASLQQFRQKPQKKRRWWWIVIAAFLGFGLIGNLLESSDSYDPYNHPEQLYQYSQTQPETDDFGSTIHLHWNGQNRYTLADSGQSGDRTLVWDAGADSYYDAESDCWLWYNTDVEPPLWQYWYEGISSDFGDYGWMEHDADGWYIEASEGNWIRLPSNYDTSGLWYIE